MMLKCFQLVKGIECRHSSAPELFYYDAMLFWIMWFNINEICKVLLKKDVWMGKYVAPKPIYIFQHLWSLSRIGSYQFHRLMHTHTLF